MKAKKYSPVAHARKMMARKWDTAAHEHDVERIAFLVAGLRRAYAAGRRAGKIGCGRERPPYAEFSRQSRIKDKK